MPISRFRPRISLGMERDLKMVAALNNMTVNAYVEQKLRPYVQADLRQAMTHNLDVLKLIEPEEDTTFAAPPSLPEEEEEQTVPPSPTSDATVPAPTE